MPNRRPLLLVIVIILLLLGSFFAASADARLIPPPGPWPAPTSATNPLTGTTWTYNGANATGNARLRVWLPHRGRRRGAITRTIGRPTVVRGDLYNRSNRRPIRGAAVTLVAQSVFRPEWVAWAQTNTTRRGRFRAVLPPGHHRRVAAVYFPAVQWTWPIYSRRVLVRASTRVWLGRPVRRSRGSYRFRGRVFAAPAGLVVALQVRNSTGRWLTTRFGKTRASGRFTIRARFPAGAFRVRAFVPSQAGWPLYSGRSNRQTVG